MDKNLIKVFLILFWLNIAAADACLKKEVVKFCLKNFLPDFLFCVQSLNATNLCFFDKCVSNICLNETKIGFDILVKSQHSEYITSSMPVTYFTASPTNNLLHGILTPVYKSVIKTTTNFSDNVTAKSYSPNVFFRQTEKLIATTPSPILKPFLNNMTVRSVLIKTTHSLRNTAIVKHNRRFVGNSTLRNVKLNQTVAIKLALTTPIVASTKKSLPFSLFVDNLTSPYVKLNQTIASSLALTKLYKTPTLNLTSSNLNLQTTPIVVSTKKSLPFSNVKNTTNTIGFTISTPDKYETFIPQNNTPNVDFFVKNGATFLSVQSDKLNNTNIKGISAIVFVLVLLVTLCMVILSKHKKLCWQRRGSFTLNSGINSNDIVERYISINDITDAVNSCEQFEMQPLNQNTDLLNELDSEPTGIANENFIDINLE